MRQITVISYHLITAVSGVPGVPLQFTTADCVVWSAGAVLDAVTGADTIGNSCGALVEAYGIIPGSTWNNAPTTVQAIYNAGQCNKYICFFFRTKYGATSATNLGTLPQQWHASWNWNRPAEHGGPGTCSTLTAGRWHMPCACLHVPWPDSSNMAFILMGTNKFHLQIIREK